VPARSVHTTAHQAGEPGAVAGLGVDAVDIARFRASVRRHPSLVDRLFTPAEQAAAGRRVDPVPSLAARFAAKEATWKALGVGLGAVGFHDVAVGAADSGAPVLVLSGRAAELADAARCRRWHLSLTHTATVAIATVLAERADGERTADGRASCSPS